MVLISTTSVAILCAFFKCRFLNGFKKVPQILCWQNVFLSQKKIFRLLSQSSVKISNVEIHRFWESGQFMETVISIGSP